MFSAAIQPMVLNPKSDLPTARYINTELPTDQPVFGFMSIDDLRYFTAGFYTADRIRAIKTPADTALLATEGYIVVGDYDTDSLQRLLSDRYLLLPQAEWDKKSCDNKQKTRIFKYFSTSGKL